MRGQMLSGMAASLLMLAFLAVLAAPAGAQIIVGGEPNTNYNSGGVSMQWWLRADAGAEEAAADPAEDGDNVQYWRDQSTNSFGGTQNEGTKQPAFNDPAANHNGEPALSYDGTADLLDFGDVLDQNSDSFTLFTVFSSPFRTVNGNEMLIDKRAGTDRFTLYLRASDSNPSLQFLVGDDDETAMGIVGTDYGELLDGMPHISVGVVDRAGNTLYHYLDGGPPDTDDISTLGAQANSATLRVGEGDVAGSFWEGTIAEIIMYKGALSSSERNDVYDYLADKYDVSTVGTGNRIIGSNGEPDPTYYSGGVSMQWWLRADAGAEEADADPAEDGDNVQYWRDQSLNSFDGTQDTGTQQPVFDDPAANHNGEPALSYDGTADVLAFGDVLDQDSDSFTLFTVLSSPFRTVTGNEMLIDKRAGTDRFTLYLRASDSNPSLQFLVGDGDESVIAIVGTDYSELLDGMPHISAGVVDRAGNTLYHYLDGGAPGTGDISTLGAQANSTTLYVGRRSDAASGFWSGTIAEIIMYRGALSSNELNDVGFYLQNKYDVDGLYTSRRAGTVLIIR